MLLEMRNKKQFVAAIFFVSQKQFFPLEKKRASQPRYPATVLFRKSIISKIRLRERFAVIHFS
jgi:hypothetical protein